MKRPLLLAILQIILFSEFAIAQDDWNSEKGKVVYENNCVACHGVTGDGRGPASAMIKNPKPRNFLGEKFKYGESKEAVFKTITNGVDGTAMPPWNALSEQERQSVAAYVLSLRKK